MLYRKYRPTTFSQIEGQEHIVQTLHGALASGRVGHAYFFAGPRGTGKTTMARLFAKTLNCPDRQSRSRMLDSAERNRHTATLYEPCNKCFSCSEINAGKSLDLIEIDAASNTGVDNIRAVIESAGTSASSSTYKIFIIDEVHMLSKSAFNALLKTLEEPPAHTLFILATTEPHKVPDTILSRVQRFDFKKLTKEQIIAKLRAIATAEKLKLKDEDFDMIASAAAGSLRDAESSLDKVMAFGGVAVLGIIPAHVHAAFLDAIAKKEASRALAQIAELHESGVHLEHFLKQFIEYVRSILIETLTLHVTRDTLHDPTFLVGVLTRFMEARTALRASPIPQLPLELAVIDLTS